MQSLQKLCQNCHKPMNGGVYRASHICPHCFFEHEGGKASRRAKKAAAADTPATAQETTASELSAVEAPVHPEVAHTPAPTIDDTPVKEVAATSAEPVIEPAEVSLSTKPAGEENIVARLGDLSGEGVITVTLTPDMFNAEGKFTGAKSEPVLMALKQGKKSALNNLKDQAALIGANSVAGITLKNGMKLLSTENARVTVTASGEAYVVEASDEFADA